MGLLEDLHAVQDSVSTTIRNLGLVIGGVVAILLAVWRSTVAERQAETAQQSLLNERYQRAAEMLGNNVLSVRLGGISALERLAAEHPDQYHIQVMKLFCAFVRNPTRDEGVAARDEPQFMMSSLRDDVQAAMTAIGKRSKRGLDIEEATGNVPLDLYSADLTGAYLVKANLAGADMRSANLVGANFMNADLSNAFLFGADLSDLQPQDGDPTAAVQSPLRFKKAGISNTRFSYEGMYPAEGLTQDQLNNACADSGNGPILAGVVDAVTGDPLVWPEPSSEVE